MREVIKVSGGKITIPKGIREKFGISDGDKLVIKNENGKIVILKPKIEAEEFEVRG